MKTFRKHIILYTLLLSLGLASCDNLVNPTGQDKTIPKIKSISKYLVDSQTLEKKKLLYEEFYNSSGKIEKYMQFDENQNVVQVNSFIYVNLSSFETTLSISSKGDTLTKVTTETVYNTIGNVEFKNIYDYKGDTVKKIIFAYDSYNNINKKETIDIATGKRDIVSYKLTYNNLGQVIKRVAYLNGQMTNQQAYSYNTNDGIGIIIKSSDLFVEQTVQYNFNEIGNIISEYHLDNLGKIIIVYKYFYTYYSI
ncbi:MAG: hypothetical protein WCR42_06970 [bacterium]